MSESHGDRDRLARRPDPWHARAVLLAKARRVVVVGPPSAVKSTLARALAGRLALPLHHLDRLDHQPGWVPTPEPIGLRRQADLAARDSWRIDGNYAATRPIRRARAQVALHLDMARALCLGRILWRVARGHGRTRPDMADGSPERLDPEFVRFVWRYPLDARPQPSPTSAHIRPPAARSSR